MGRGVCVCTLIKHPVQPHVGACRKKDKAPAADRAGVASEDDDSTETFLALDDLPLAGGALDAGNLVLQLLWFTVLWGLRWWGQAAWGSALAWA